MMVACAQWCGIDYTLLLVMLAALIVGFVAGMLGVFVMVRGESLLGDAVAHASLPGILVTLLLTEHAHPITLIWGGATTGLLGAWSVAYLTRRTVLKRDAAIGIVLSLFFGIGLVLVTILQKYEIARQAALNKFMFGALATIAEIDLVVIVMVAIVISILLGMWYRALVILAFDPIAAQLAGYSPRLVDGGGVLLVVVIVATGLQVCGAVLMSALLLAPAAAARQWSSRIGVVTMLAGAFGATAGLMGAYISGVLIVMPTGPAIVIVATLFVLASFILSPSRGYVGWLRRGRCGTICSNTFRDQRSSG